jgi:eukaryotic-like serine/threonine-protein kinase
VLGGALPWAGGFLGCVDIATKAALAAERLSGAELLVALEHVAHCAACRTEVHAAQAHALGVDVTCTTDPRPIPRRFVLSSDPKGGVSRPVALGDDIGPYRLLERLGAGGMGMVFAAAHRELNRTVALKVLRPDPSGSPGDEGAQARLLREAQTMAQLSHPNVVSVYDAGSWQSKVYLAMEHVEGCTLRRWLNAERRSWREVLGVLLQAGRGLAAAHAVGIIHRDFKPENVLISTDGRAQVTDFGLARPLDSHQEPGEATPWRNVQSAPVTPTGAFAGTPGYMAPEQFHGGAGDTRVDQFGFCVALWEGLYGRRPFRGQLDPTLPQPLPTTPKNSRIPRFLHRALLRGLSIDPEDRFPSMDALVAELSRDPSRPLRHVLAIAAGLAVLAVAVGIGTRLVRPRVIAGCTVAGSEWAGRWDDGKRNAIRAAFAATGNPSGDADAKAVISALDSHASSWTALHQTACEKAQASEDETALLTIACLHRQQTILTALADVLARADARTEALAVSSAGSLAPPNQCSNLRALLQQPKPPSDPKMREEVDVVRTQIAVDSARVEAGAFKEGAEALEPLTERAARLGYRPLEAEAFLALGAALSRQGKVALAAPALIRAEFAAEAGGADLLAAEAASRLVSETGLPGGRSDEARRWEERTRILLERIGGDPVIEGRLELTLADLAGRAGNMPEAFDHGRRGVEILQHHLGNSHPYTLTSLKVLAALYYEDNRFLEALALVHQVIAQQEQVFGPGHPALASSYEDAAADELELGRYAEAQHHLEIALTITQDASGTRSSHYAELLSVLSYLMTEKGRPEQALGLAREASSVMLGVAGGADTLEAATVATIEGSALQALRRYRESKAILDRALPTLAKSFGNANAAVVETNLVLADDLIGMGRNAEAIALLEQENATLAAHVPPWKNVARGHFALARALGARSHGNNPKRAIELALRAREELSHAPWKRKDLDTINVWLRARGVR